MADPITFQRKHGPSCAAGHKKFSYTFEVEEVALATRRGGLKPCDCRIYACGTLGGVYKRVPTHERTWEYAREFAAPFVAADSWNIEPPPPPENRLDVTSRDAVLPEKSGAPPEKSAGLTIDDAIKICMDEHVTEKSAAATIRQYQCLLKEFAAFSHARGYRWLQEWTRADVRAFRASWEVQRSTRNKKMRYLHAFFEIFVDDETLAGNPAHMRIRRNRAARMEAEDAAQKNPYTDAELERMLEACRAQYRPGIKRGNIWTMIRTRKYTAEDLADFIQVSFCTGLRIGDVATFDISRLTPEG